MNESVTVVASRGGASAAGLVLLLSPERSGSTLLATMLGANRQVLAPPELFLLRYRSYAAWRSDKPAAFASLAWLLGRLGEDSDARSADARFGSMAAADVYRWLLERIGERRLLIDKTPAYGRDPSILDRAERLVPEPRYLWLVRHPLGVANSWIERRRERRWSAVGRIGAATASRIVRSQRPPAQWLTARLDEAATNAGLERWRLVHESIERFVSKVPCARVQKVFYEDIVRDPERTTRALATWLGVPFTAAMLEPWKHLPDGLGRGIGDEKILDHRRIDAGRATSWRARLGDHVLDTPIRALMTRLGVAE